MTLRLTTLLALCAALPSTLATGHAWVSFLVPKQWKDTASVRGKNSMDGEMITMTRAENDPQSQEVCANLVDDWGTGDITTCGSYYGLTAIGFSEPTKNPRPINVTLGDDIYHCTISMSKIGKDTTWFVDWGLSSAEDGTKIVCKRSTI